MLVLSKFHVNYGQDQVLGDINLSIQAGEKVALIGPSGAGKTTLLRNLFQLRPHQAAFIHQNHALVSRLSVFHNVFSGRLDHHSLVYNLRNLIHPMAREVKAVSSILGSLGIEEKLFEKAGSLSGGQMQRVAVARALFRASPLLLGDEPVSSIDPKQAQQVLELLKNSAETVILSLHSVQLAMESFERIIGLRKGRIFFDLPAQQVSPHQLEELFAP